MKYLILKLSNIRYRKCKD